MAYLRLCHDVEENESEYIDPEVTEGVERKLVSAYTLSTPLV